MGVRSAWVHVDTFNKKNLVEEGIGGTELKNISELKNEQRFAIGIATASNEGN